MHSTQNRVVKIFGLHKSLSLTKNWQRMCWIVMSLLALLGGAVLLQTSDFDSMIASLNALNAQLAQHPILLMLALAILPGIGFPISPLLIVFGTSLTPQYGLITTCLLGIAMQSFCTTWAYAIAAGPLKNCLTQWLHRRYTLPSLQSKGAITATLLIRLAPGFPYALQNIILGLIGVPLKTYLLISIPITAMISSIFISSGAAIIDANTQGLLIGFATLVLVLIGLRIGAKKLKQHVN
jgi:uncharacterized membrane protein YdjX (TVP38/TMEM64 family)